LTAIATRAEPTEEQLGKSAEEEEDALLPIRQIEAHSPLDRRQRLAGATEKGLIVPRKPVGHPQPRIHRQRLLERLRRLLQLSRRGAQHPLRVFWQDCEKLIADRRSQGAVCSLKTLPDYA
jgi:hypothetical protein